MTGISKREWIKWESDSTRSSAQGHEPTSTLVLTSPGNRFVDLRILLAAPADVPQIARDAAIQPLSQLDWAFAGFSSAETIPDPNGHGAGRATTSHWKHLVDSRHADADRVVDCGTVYPPSNGLTLETGSMTNPATGQMQKYEEMWRDIVPRLRKDGGLECAVLQLQHDDQKTRGMVVRLAQFCQGLIRQGDAVALERWEMKRGEGWTRTVRMGDLWMPCGVAMEMDRLVLGGKVNFGADSWTVAELSVT